jgi:hypothetical protein
MQLAGSIMQMKRFIRALSTIPKQVWWMIGVPVMSVVLLVLDRHTATVAFSVWVAFRAYRGLVATRPESRAAEEENNEFIWRNPSTGLPMVGNNPGGVDTAGYYYGEDT